MTSTVPTVGELDPYRLPRHTRPIRYDVTLEPDVATATFGGDLRIDVVTDTPTNEIVLNAAELEIGHCTVDGVDAVATLDEATERLILTTPEPIEPGPHTVEIAFHGVLNDQLRGWYRSSYRDAEGVEHVIATTQMQATDCRRGFPCFDEPDFKAVFAVTLVVDPDLVAVSNAPEIERRVRADGKVEVRFDDTMQMSSYLVAFVVGRLAATDPIDVGGVAMRVIYVPGKEGLTGFALDVAAFCLRWFQEYYGIDYPGAKLDLLALPDFAAGAMENLGCITFRESLLLVDPATATQSERQLVADVIAHEIAHMWFGDLVTMAWWNGIWLNEAFATFMELAACDAYRPAWERWTSFGLERSLAFETDSLSSTRSVEYPVRSPEDCEGMFDVLTYQKGGALLRMLEQYLGDERFRQGVNHYLRTHAYGNTETGDLWDAIEHTSGEPVRRLMDSWIWQPGYPLVSARIDGGELVLSQRRFSFGPDDASTALWVIPVAVGQSRDQAPVLLEGDSLRLPATDGPIVVNAGGHGFFRVEYSDELRQRLTAEVVAGLSTLERYNLVDDAWNAVIAGRLDAIEYLALLEHFRTERELGVWQSIAVGLRTIARMVSDDDAAAAAFASRVVALAGPALQELDEPAPDESELRAKLRGLLLVVVAVLGRDEAAQARGRRCYDDWVSDPTGVDAELAAAATSVVAATGGADDYELMRQRALHGRTPQEQLRHLYALADYRDADLMQRTCELAISDDVRTQNAPFLLRSCLANPRYGRQAWEWLRRNWGVVNARFPRSLIARMVEPVRTLDLATDVGDVQAFFSEHPIPQSRLTLDQILERQRVNAATRARNSDALISALTVD